MVQNPGLPFLVFWGGRRGKPPAKQGFFPNEPLEPWKGRGKRSKKQGIPRRGKNKEFQKDKERKDREWWS